jgi:hypothetical protein
MHVVAMSGNASCALLLIRWQKLCEQLHDLIVANGEGWIMQGQELVAKEEDDRVIGIFEHMLSEFGEDHSKKLIVEVGKARLNINEKDWNGNTPIMWATTCEVAKVFLSFGAEVNNQEICYKNSFLHKCSYENNVEMVQMLCSLPNIDGRLLDKYNNIPLETAIDRGNLAVAEILFMLLHFQGHTTKGILTKEENNSHRIQLSYEDYQDGQIDECILSPLQLKVKDDNSPFYICPDTNDIVRHVICVVLQQYTPPCAVVMDSGRTKLFCKGLVRDVQEDIIEVMVVKDEDGIDIDSNEDVVIVVKKACVSPHIEIGSSVLVYRIQKNREMSCLFSVKPPYFASQSSQLGPIKDTK